MRKEFTRIMFHIFTSEYIGNKWCSFSAFSDLVTNKIHLLIRIHLHLLRIWLYPSRNFRFFTHLTFDYRNFIELLVSQVWTTNNALKEMSKWLRITQKVSTMCRLYIYTEVWDTLSLSCLQEAAEPPKYVASNLNIYWNLGCTSVKGSF